MDRTYLPIFGVVLLCASAYAERTSITGVSATYWSASDEVEFRIWFDRPVTFPGAYLSLAGWPGDDWPPPELFYFKNDFATRGSVFDVGYVEYTPAGGVAHEELRGKLPYTMNDRLFEATVPFSLLGVASPNFQMEIAIHGNNSLPNESNVFQGARSSIDERVVYTPEPASSSLAAIAAVGLFTHLWLARRRKLKR